METTNDMIDRPRRRRPPLARLSILAVAVAVLVAACGGGGGDPSAVASLGEGQASTNDATADGGGDKSFEDALLAFASCMREQGIDMPDPKTDGGGGGMVVLGPGQGAAGVSEERFAEAEEQCGHLMEGFEPDLSPEEKDRMQDEMLAFARCMREHGIHMPDPEADGEMTMEIGGDGIDPHDPDFQAAEKECRPEGATGFESPSGGPQSGEVTES